MPDDHVDFSNAMETWLWPTVWVLGMTAMGGRIDCKPLGWLQESSTGRLDIGNSAIFFDVRNVNIPESISKIYKSSRLSA
jgi:hypothetical protein